MGFQGFFQEGNDIEQAFGSRRRGAFSLEFGFTGKEFWPDGLEEHSPHRGVFSAGLQECPGTWGRCFGGGDIGHGVVVEDPTDDFGFGDLCRLKDAPGDPFLCFGSGSSMFSDRCGFDDRFRV